MTPQNGTYELLAQKEQEALETQGVLSDADESEVPFLRRTEKKRRNRKDLYLIVSTRLGRDPEAKWPYNAGYGADITNHTLLDERWEALSINDGIVAIDKQWAYENNLGETQPFPWDDSKGLYLITAFHQLHCVITIHRTVYELHHGLPRTSATEHALHCLDHLRTDAMCEADDFLLPSGPPRYMNKGPRGQARVCRNFDQLVAWARQRNACYQHITNDEFKFADEHSQFERFFNCSEDSPYYDTMLKWKNDHGY